MTLVFAHPSAPENASSTPTDREALVRAHLPLVDHLVREVASRVPTHVDRDELTSAAMYALAVSARTFDESVGATFGSFASIRIRGALTDELRSMDWASRSVRTKARRVEQVRETLTHRLGRPPLVAELAEALKTSTADIAAVEADVHRAAVQSLHIAESGADDLPEPADGPEAALLRREELGYLRDAVAMLPERLRTVVEQYFLQQRRMADIAAELGVTESRISQLRSEALSWLREGMRVMDDQRRSVRTADGRQPSAAYRAAVASRSSLAGRLTTPV